MRFVLDTDPATNFLKWLMIGIVAAALALGIWALANL